MSDNDIKSRAHIRLARPDDYKAVLAVNQFIYDGGDYLPVMYHMFIQNKRADCFVLEVDGQVVGFKLNQVTGDGKRLISIAARMKEAYQGQGLMDLMNQECLRLSLEKRPGVVARAYCTQNYPVTQAALKKGTEHGTQKNTTYFINREQLLEAIAGFKESISGRVSCNKCSSSEFVGLLKTNQLIRNLFSNSIMPTAVNWYPTKLSDDNDLKEMLANHTFFTSKSGEDGSVSGIGYLGCNPCSVGIGVSAHIWCREMDSFKSLLVEMMSYVTMVTQPGTTLVYNTSYSGVEDEDVRAFLATQLGSYYVSKVAVNQGGSYIETPVVRDTSSMTSKL